MEIKKPRHESMSITGHRWHKLPFGTNEKDPRCIALVETISGILTQQFDGGITHVIQRHGAGDGILEHCLKLPTITSPEYKKGCEMIRNRYMVDNSLVLLACWDGRSSGTGNTVKYAVSVGIPYIQINPYV